jgi:hypothetical protein
MPASYSGARKFVKCCQHWKAIESVGHDLNCTVRGNVATDKEVLRQHTTLVRVFSRPFEWMAFERAVETRIQNFGNLLQRFSTLVSRVDVWVGRAGPLPRALTSSGRQKGGHRPGTR